MRVFDADPSETVREIIGGELPTIGFPAPEFMRDALASVDVGYLESCGSTLSPMDRLELKLDRIQATLDKLLAALADEPEDPPATDLEGNPVGGERDQGSPL